MASSFVETPGTIRPLLWLSMPVLAEQVLHLMVGYADLWITGNLLAGESYVAAMTLVLYACWLLGMLFAFVATGATPLTARFTGAGEPAEANRVMNQSIALGLAWAGVIMAVGFPALRPLIELMGLEGDSADAATRYLRIELAVLPAIMIERVGLACLRGAGDTLSGLYTMVLVNGVNIGVSYTLAAGVPAWGVEPLGWDGVAYGTAAGHLVGAVVFLALLAGGRAGYRLRLREMAPDPVMLRRILRIGIPGGLDSVLVVACNLAYLRIVLQFGDVAAAAHGVAIQIEALAYMPGGAFQIAAATTVGQYLGAKDPARATRSVLLACACAATLMTAAGVVFATRGDVLVATFLEGKPEVEPLAAELLGVIALAMPSLAVAMVLAGGLRGAGDTRGPLWITLAGFGLVRIPLALWFSQETIALPGLGVTLTGWGLGAVGAWYGALSDIGVRSLLMAGRFWRGDWRRIEV